MEDNNILHVENLNVYYKNISKRLAFKKINNRKQVVYDVSFDINKGEMVGLVGESGCGKSTIGKAVLGLTDDLEGTIIHKTKMPQMIFQDPKSSLNPKMKISRILEEPLRIQGTMDKTEIHDRALQMLDLMGLHLGYAERYPHELSGGQRQRVCTGLSLMLNPGFVVADEPVSALDVTVQAQIMRLLKKVNVAMNVSMLFISHDLKVVYQLCDRIMVMKDGYIIEQGTDEEIFYNPKEEYTKQLLKAAGI